MTRQPPSDDECDRLLDRVRMGDREALGLLFETEAGRLIAIARRILRRELAEEAVQEAFVSAWRAAPAFDSGRGRARAWLTTIVRNKALNMLRDDARLDFMRDDELQSFQERGGGAMAAYAMLGEGNALRACLDQLEPQRRHSILLAYVLGYSHGEIAATLNTPIGTIKAWIRRGVIALQECLS